MEKVLNSKTIRSNSSGLSIGSGIASTSTVDLDIEAGSDTESRDRGLGGTVEIETDESLLETPMMSRTSGDSSCPLWLRKELEDAEFIPMPDDPMQSIPDQLSSISESVTLPYEELKELKAAAAALSTRKDLPTMRMSSGRVNGLEEDDLCKSGECKASCEVTQLRETVAQQDMRIQMLEKQVSEQKKENERLWAAVSRLSHQGCDSNGNHRSDQMPRDGGGREGFKNHGGRSAGASV